MKVLRGISTLAVALLAMVAWGQGVPTWLSTCHDFGTFRDNIKEVTCEMQVVNTGDSALMITRVQSNCGCTVAEYTKAVMQPGDTGKVTVTYSTRDIPGEFEKKVFVYTNGKPRRSVLSVKGCVIGSPKNVADRFPVAVGACALSKASLPLGEIKKGESRTNYFSGYNTASDTMIVSAKCDSKRVALNVLPDTVPPGGLFIVSAYFTSAGDVDYGFNTEAVTVSVCALHGDTALAGSTVCHVMAQVKEDFSRLTDKQRKNAPVVEVNADKVNFEEVAPNEAVTRTFTITNRGKSALRIRRLFVPDSKGIAVSADRDTVAPGKHATVTVKLDAPALHGSVVNTSLTVVCNDPYNPETQLRIVGVVL